MRLPSDAQAVLLACVQGHEAADEQVFVPPAASRSKISLWVQRTGREVRAELSPFDGAPLHETTDLLLTDASLRQAREATLHACTRHGWLHLGEEHTIAVARVGAAYNASRQSWGVTVRPVSLTEDGLIALGAWRQRKLAAPPEPPPTLTGQDRELIALAEQAERFGFLLLPATEQARREARRLARTPFARRGWGAGPGTRSLLPTALGAVEVNPQAADRPPERIL